MRPSVCEPSIQETKGEKSGTQGQLGLHKDTLSQKPKYRKRNVKEGRKMR
jgi:hypothetical protein